MATFYSLNIYFDSSNPGTPISNPSQLPSWGAGYNTFAPQHWEWDIVDGNSGNQVLNEGSGILEVPPAGSNLPPLSPTVPIQIGLFDRNVLNNQSVMSLSNMLIQAVFTFSESAPVSYPLTPQVTSTPSFPLSSGWDTSVCTETITASGGPQSTTMMTGYSTEPGTPPAAVWSIQLTPTTYLDNCTSVEISVCIQLYQQSSQAVVQYCIDPEMQMDEQN